VVASVGALSVRRVSRGLAHDARGWGALAAVEVARRRDGVGDGAEPLGHAPRVDALHVRHVGARLAARHLWGRRTAHMRGVRCPMHDAW
jgi:hypothetical protein